MRFANAIPRSKSTPGSTAASANATPSNVLWLSFSTITRRASPVPPPGPRVRSRSRGGVNVDMRLTIASVPWLRSPSTSTRVRARFSSLARLGALRRPRRDAGAGLGDRRDRRATCASRTRTSAARSRRAVADRRAASRTRASPPPSFLGCTPDEVVFGANMTTLNFALSRTVGRELRAGDEIVVTRLDHDANVAPWLELAHDLDLDVRFVEHAATTRRSTSTTSSGSSSERTRVVAFPVASNAVGTLVGRRAGSPSSRTRPARSRGRTPCTTRRTGRSTSPQLGVDVLVCSPYKFFGPHLGLAFARAELLERWRPYKVRPAADEPLGARFETGTLAARAARRLRRRRRVRATRRLGRDRGARARARRALPRGPAPTAGRCTACRRWRAACRRSRSRIRRASPRDAAARLGERGSRSGTATTTPSR